MSSALVAWAIIFLGAVSAAFWLKISPARSIPVSYFCVIIIGFAAGLLNQLGSLRWLIPACSLIVFVKAVLVLRKLAPDARMSRLRETLFKPSLLVFGMGSVVLFWMAFGRRFNQWDEFSHWGLAGKNMHLLDAFANVAGANTYFTTYPPGATILEYFFTEYDLIFSDASAIASISTFCLALLLPLVDRLPQRMWMFTPVAAVILMFLPMSMFPDVNTSVYVDALLGLLAAFILLVHFGGERVGRSEILQETLGVVVLTLTKPSGLGLAALVTLILVVDRLVRARREPQTVQGPRRFGRGWWAAVGRASLAPVIPLIGGILASRAWNFELIATNTPKAPGISLTQMFDVFGSQETVNQYAIRPLYVEALGNRLGPTAVLTAANIAVLFAVVIWVISRTYPQGSAMRARTGALALAAPVCAVLYWWSLLALYMYEFSDYEGIRLASFARYQGTFVLFLIVLLLDQLLARSSSGLPRLESRQPAALIAVFLCGAVIPWGSALGTIQHASDASAHTRDSMVALDVAPNYLALLQESGGRVYYVDAGSDGFSYWTFRYAVVPSQVSPIFSWSFGPKTGPNAYWNTDITVEEWQDSLRRDYDFVYIYHFDDYFAENFDSAFCEGQEPSDRTLFAVSSLGSNSACLTPAPGP